MAKLFGLGRKDPYWDIFVNRKPADPKNLLAPPIAAAPGGPVYSLKTEVHDRRAMSEHLKEFALFLGADAVGIVALDEPRFGDDLKVNPADDLQRYAFAVVCGVRFEYDPAESQGVGGQLAVQKLAVVNFSLRSYIRELGYIAQVGRTGSPALAVAAALGRLDARGRFKAASGGRHLCLQDAVLTDLPLATDEPSA